MASRQSSTMFSLSGLVCRAHLTLAFVVLVLASSAWSQESRGTILGRVTDSSNAVVPGATVRLTHIASGTARATVANDQGNFAAPLLPPGIYEVTAEKTGFKRFVRKGIELRINDRLELNVTLEVGGITESVTVSAETPLLETASGSIGQVIDAKRLADLPAPLGSPYDLIRIAPNTNFTQGNFRQDQPWEPGASVAYALAGSPGKSAEITLDGSVNTARDEGGRVVVPSYVPPIDAVAEMKVQTASFDGTTGQTSGGLINVSLKSGTNSLHGTTYFSYLPTALTANTFFSNKNGIARQDSTANRWGGSVNGPVWIPKVYNGKNRTFFMYAYEGIHYASSRGSNFTVPTEAQRAGDFSQLLALGSQYQIYNPFTRRAVANGRFQEDPFPNNMIPSNLVSPIATKLLNTRDYPLPLNGGTTADGSNNLPEPGAVQHVAFFNHAARADQNFSDRHRLFLRLNKDKTQFADPLFFGADSLYSGTNFWYYQSGFSIDDVYNITPTMVMNIRVGDSRYVRAQNTKPHALGIDLTTLGFPAYYNNSFDPSYRRIPSINLSDYSSFTGTPYTPLWKPQDTRSLYATFNKIHGSHELKWGFEYRQYHQRNYNITAAATGGVFSFDSTYTRGPLDNSTASPRGQGLAAFLLGVPTSGSKDYVDSYAEMSTLWAGYFQDDWKVTRKLTLNLSLRYEVEGPLTERFNRSVRSFDPNAPHSGGFDTLAQAAYAANPTPERAASTFSTKGGLTYAGVNGQPRELFNRDTNNFMPRIGFAYNPTKKMVVRGGYGLYFGPLGQRRADVIQTNFSRTTNLVPTNDNGLTFVASLANPYPTGFLTPIGAGLGADTNLGQSISFFNPDLQANRIQKWQIDIQRELPGQIVVEAGYIGSRGDNLQATRDLRYFPSQYLSTSPSRDQTNINYWSANVANPFINLVPGTSRNGTLVSRDSLVRNYPQFTGISNQTNEGRDFYSALEARVERRFSKGITVQASYTFSKLIDQTGFLNPDDKNPERVISGSDYPHHVTLSYIYELPFGRKRHFLANIHPIASAIVSGWQVSGIWTVQSGSPLGFGDAIFYGADLSSVVLPADQRTWSRWFDTSAFEKDPNKQLANHYRTLSSRFGDIRGPRLNYWDMSALKNSQISEKFRVQIRAEFLNAFNQVWLAGPNTTPSSTSFGQITSEGSVPRRIQMQFKLLF